MPFSHDPRAANKLHWPTFCFCFCPVGKNSVRSSEIVEKVWEEQKMSRSHVSEWCKRLVQKTGARVKWREWCKGSRGSESRSCWSYLSIFFYARGIFRYRVLATGPDDQPARLHRHHVGSASLSARQEAKGVRSPHFTLAPVSRTTQKRVTVTLSALPTFLATIWAILT